MPDSEPSPADAVLERLDDEITFLVDNLRDVSDSLADLAFSLDTHLTEHGHEQVRAVVDRVRATLNTQVTNDLTALVGLGAIRHGPPADPACTGTVTADLPALVMGDPPPPGTDPAGRDSILADLLADAADHLRRLVAFVGEYFDLARVAAEHGNAERAMSAYRLARRAARQAPEAYQIWVTCLVEAARGRPDCPIETTWPPVPLDPSPPAIRQALPPLDATSPEAN
ncbi:hypothetical protein AWW66_22425 [Micromonospora rosaria]|uniref:Uncharacterized protein n=1 Tax=Micromonospora rosaria TaxID=47874 RepID=A0A136PMY6_9ACTN|nr:hypothetical protein [Micromonospora rosaria]KXK59783.1 hypothetical protein AWW66_22425 [Micromonospora rosaria]